MPEQSKLAKALWISAGIHIGAIVILALGISFEDKPTFMPQAPSAPAIQAVMIDQQKVNDRAEELKQKKRDAERQEQQRQAELERKAREARQAREQEQLKLKQLEVEREQKVLETQKAIEAAKAAKLKLQLEQEKAQKAEAERKQIEQKRKASEEAAKLAAEKRKQEEAAVKKAEAERKQREDERKRKEEAERKQKQEAERKLKEEAERKRKAEAEARARQEQEMADAMAAEHSALSQTRNKQVMSEVDKYRSMIAATIQRNLVVDESMRGKTCKVFIRLANDGFVTAVQTLDGDPVICRAAKNAINKAGRLPVSPEADVYNQMREINLTVSPEFN